MESRFPARGIPLVLALAVLAAAGPGHASGGDHQWSDDFAVHGFDLWIRASAVFQGKLVVGGEFTKLDRRSLARVAILEDGEWNALGDGFDDTVYALWVWQGQLYAGGKFRHSGSRPVSAIARWDGDAWQEVGGGLDGTVFDFTAYGGDLVVAGNFDEGGAHRYVSRWDGAAWKPFPISPLFGPVLAAEVYWEKLYVGGSFEYGRGIARWSGSGWDVPGGAFTSGSSVSDLIAHAGRLWAVGSFTKGDARNVATWIDHQEWSPVGDELADQSQVACIDTLGGAVWVGASRMVAHWGGTGWIRIDREVNGRVYTVRSWNGRLFAGGTRWTPAGGRGAADFVEAGGWTPAHAPDDGPDSGVFAFAPWEGGVVVAGSMARGGAVPISRIGIRDGADWTPLGDGLNGTVRALLVHDGALWAGGSFNGSGPQVLARRIARWNGAAWEGLGAGFENGQVQALAVHEGVVLAGGTFTASAGRAVAGIGAWEGDTWNPRGSPLKNVRDLIHWNGQLVIGGDFDLADGVSRHLGRWNGTDWETFAGSPNSAVTSLEHFEGDLVVAGAFTQIDGQPLAKIARWDGSAWEGFGGGFDRNVQALTVWNGFLIAGGEFRNADGAPLTSLARWDGATWQPFGSGVTGAIWSLLADGPDLWVGGALGAGGLPRSYLARWRGPEAAVGPDSGPIPRVGDVAPAPIVLRAWPNPAPGSADQFLGFSLPSRTDVTFTVHDVGGRLVRAVTARDLPEGRHTATWDGRDDAGHRVVAGVYFIRLTAAGESVTHKIVRVD